MRPSIELPRVSGADSKLDITTVRRSLLRLRRVICHALVSEQTCASSWAFWRPVTLTFDTAFWTKNWHIAYCCRRKRCKLIFLHAFLFFFELRHRTRRTSDRWTNRQTDRRARRLMRPHDRKKSVWRIKMTSLRQIYLQILLPTNLRSTEDATWKVSLTAATGFARNVGHQVKSNVPEFQYEHRDHGT